MAAKKEQPTHIPETTVLAHLRRADIKVGHYTDVRKLMEKAGYEITVMPGRGERMIRLFRTTDVEDYIAKHAPKAKAVKAAAPADDSNLRLFMQGHFTAMRSEIARLKTFMDERTAQFDQMQGQLDALQEQMRFLISLWEPKHAAPAAPAGGNNDADPLSEVLGSTDD